MQTLLWGTVFMYSLLYSVFKSMLRTTCYYYSSFTDKEKPRYKTATDLGYQPGHLTREHMLLTTTHPLCFLWLFKVACLLYTNVRFISFLNIYAWRCTIYICVCMCVCMYTHTYTDTLQTKPTVYCTWTKSNSGEVQKETLWHLGLEHKQGLRIPLPEFLPQRVSTG